MIVEVNCRCTVYRFKQDKIHQKLYFYNFVHILPIVEATRKKLKFDARETQLFKMKGYYINNFIKKQSFTVNIKIEKMT